MSDFLEELRKENIQKRETVQHKKTELELRKSSKELDAELNAFNKKPGWNTAHMQSRIKFWAITIVCGIFGSVVFYKILMKFIR